MTNLKGLILLCSLFIATMLSAQAPQAISYQAVLRNASGIVQANSTADLRFSILQGSVTGSAVYVETHSVSTDAFGSFSLAIGNGTPTTGVFASINWGNGPYFLQTEMDTASNGSYMVLSTSQFLSVPYALHAETASRVTGATSGVGCMDTLQNNEVLISNYSFVDTDNNSIPDQVSAEFTISPTLYQEMTMSVVTIKLYDTSGMVTSMVNWSGIPAIDTTVPMNYSNVAPGETIIYEMIFVVNGCQKLFRYETTL